MRQHTSSRPYRSAHRIALSDISTKQSMCLREPSPLSAAGNPFGSICFQLDMPYRLDVSLRDKTFHRNPHRLMRRRTPVSVIFANDGTRQRRAGACSRRIRCGNADPLCANKQAQKKPHLNKWGDGGGLGVDEPCAAGGG